MMKILEPKVYMTVDEAIDKFYPLSVPMINYNHKDCYA